MVTLVEKYGLERGYLKADEDGSLVLTSMDWLEMFEGARDFMNWLSQKDYRIISWESLDESPEVFMHGGQVVIPVGALVKIILNSEMKE